MVAKPLFLDSRSSSLSVLFISLLVVCPLETHLYTSPVFFHQQLFESDGSLTSSLSASFFAHASSSSSSSKSSKSSTSKSKSHSSSSSSPSSSIPKYSKSEVDKEVGEALGAIQKRTDMLLFGSILRRTGQISYLYTVANERAKVKSSSSSTLDRNGISILAPIGTALEHLPLPLLSSNSKLKDMVKGQILFRAFTSTDLKNGGKSMSTKFSQASGGGKVTLVEKFNPGLVLGPNNDMKDKLNGSSLIIAGDVYVGKFITVHVVDRVFGYTY